MLKMADKYNIVMFGKTGKGKSTLGNVLLGRDGAFITTSSASSCTKCSTLQANVIQGIHVNVVDTPGLMDTDHSLPQVLMRVYDSMSLCEEGFDAFILVMKFGDKYTEEEKKTVEILERAFGPDFFNVCIIVMTHGELFDIEDLPITFDEWIKKNTASYNGLFEKCSRRVHLFYNKSKEEKRSKPRDDVFRQIKTLSIKYLTSTFEQHVNERKKISLEFKLPDLSAKIQEQNSLLIAFIEKVVYNVNDITEDDVYTIERQAINLYESIVKEDDGTGIMSQYITEVNNHISNLNVISKSKNKRHYLETLLKHLKDEQISRKSILLTAVNSLVSWFLASATTAVPFLAVLAGGNAVTQTGQTISKIHQRWKDGKAIKDIEDQLKKLDTAIQNS